MGKKRRSDNAEMPFEDAIEANTFEEPSNDGYQHPTIRGDAFQLVVHALMNGKKVTFNPGLVAVKMTGTTVHFTNGEKRGLYTLRPLAEGATIS